MDYYEQLGVKRNATQDEIKQAYRKLAMKHHPDRGGDQIRFQHINEAYDALKDPDTRAKYDAYGERGAGFGNANQYRSGPGGYEFHWDSAGSPFSGMDDLFQYFGFRGNNSRAKNRPINIPLDITLEDVLEGKNISFELQLPSGRTKLITVDVPPGIQDGQQIRYEGMGDDSHRGLKIGDVIITVRIRNHPIFERHGDNILCEATVGVIDLILGGQTVVQTLSGKNLTINVPAGTQPDTVLSCKGEGLPNLRTKIRGNLLVKIKGIVPRNLSQAQKDKLERLRNGI